MNPTCLRRLGLAGVVAAALPACQPQGAGSIHVDRPQLKQYTAVPDRKTPESRPAKARSTKALPRASVPRR
jgi:hypothetical protein